MIDNNCIKKECVLYYKKEEYKNQSKDVKDNAVHWVIALFEEKKAIEYLNKGNKDLKFFTKPHEITIFEKKEKISTLALAVVIGKKEVATFLMEHKFIHQKFSDFSAIDKKILKDLFHKSLKNTWLIGKDNKEIKLSELDCKTLDETFGFQYQDFIFVSEGNKKNYVNDLKCDGRMCPCTSNEILNVQLNKMKENYDKNLPRLNIQWHQEISEATKCDNFGLFSKNVMEAYTIFAQYTGEYKISKNIPITSLNYYKNFKQNDASYTSVNVDGKKTGNLARFANFGFPNSGLGPFCSEKVSFNNRFQKPFLFTLDHIKEGEEILWNYGPQLYFELYNSKFILLNKEKMLDFFKQGPQPILDKIESFISEYQIKPSARGQLEGLSISSKLDYVINVPSASIYLHVKNCVNMIDLFKSNCRSLIGMKKNFDLPYKFMLKIAKFFEELDAELKEKTALKIKMYNFIEKNIETISVIQLLHILKEALLEIKSNELTTENIDESLDLQLSEVRNYDWEKDQDHPLSLNNMTK